jgi:hypothetical protein
MSRRFVFVLFVAFVTMSAAGLTQAPPTRPFSPAITRDSTPALDMLPVRRVVLYKTGVGYFEHLGQVRNRQDVTIRFTSAQLDDVLKFLTTIDMGKGQITLRFRILDGDLRQEVGRYLDLVGSSRERDVRSMVISTTGTGERPLFVSYVSEVPIWKSTYRLLLPDSGKPLLQGWAIVDNTTGPPGGPGTPRGGARRSATAHRGGPGAAPRQHEGASRKPGGETVAAAVRA